MTIKYLVLSGGGPNTISQFGAIKVLNNKIFDINNIKQIYANSAGTLLAILLALKCDIEDIEEYLIKKPWGKYFSNNINDILKLNNYKGFINHDFISDILKDFLKSKDIDVNTTLKEFYNLTNIELYFYTTKVNDYSLVELSHLSEPNLKIIDASIMSSSLPPIFGPIKYKDNFYIDGGLYNNYPINSCLQKMECEHEEVLGIRVRGKDSFLYSSERIESDNIVNYFGKLLSDMVCKNMTDDDQINIKYNVVINAIYDTADEGLWKNFAENEEFRKELIKLGEMTAQEFIAMT